MNEPPEQEAQSGWQGRQAPEEEKVPAGQVATHLPFEASWLLLQVRQNVEDPKHVLHEESQATNHSKKMTLRGSDI